MILVGLYRSGISGILIFSSCLFTYNTPNFNEYHKSAQIDINHEMFLEPEMPPRDLRVEKTEAKSVLLSWQVKSNVIFQFVVSMQGFFEM